MPAEGKPVAIPYERTVSRTFKNFFEEELESHVHFYRDLPEADDDDGAEMKMHVTEYQDYSKIGLEVSEIGPVATERVRFNVQFTVPCELSNAQRDKLAELTAVFFSELVAMRRDDG